MPYKNKELALERQRQYNKKHYKTHTTKYKKIQKERRQEIKVWFAEYKQNLSCPCGENHPACMDFHHLDASQKKAEISYMVANGYSKERILAEVEKCTVMCKNCHAKLHWNEKVCVCNSTGRVLDS